MIEWFAVYWSDLFTGFVFGSLFSFVRRFWLRLVLSTGLYVMTYKFAVTLVAHAVFRWSNELVGRTLLGIVLGCLVRPVGSALLRQIRSAMGRSSEG